MLKEIMEMLKGAFLSAALTGAVLLGPLTAEAAQQPQKNAAIEKNELSKWQEFHSMSGNCKMRFPHQPEHVSEKMSMPDGGYELKYDAYIATLEQHSVFMLLVAQYPDFVDESYAHVGLESFLNGILNHNPGNQLIFADLVLVNGHEAIEFFIRTGNIYFKGRALMVKNSLYLLAMECEIVKYDEKNYNHFINSFQFAQ